MEIMNKLKKGQVTILGKTIPAFLIVAMFGIGTAAAAGYLLLTATSNLTVAESMALTYYEGVDWKNFCNGVANDWTTNCFPAVRSLGPYTLYPSDTSTFYVAGSNAGTNSIVMTFDSSSMVQPGVTLAVDCIGGTVGGVTSTGLKIYNAGGNKWYVLLPGGSNHRAVGATTSIAADAAPVLGYSFNTLVSRGEISATDAIWSSITPCA
jgi:hypothetical protein